MHYVFNKDELTNKLGIYAPMYGNIIDIFKVTGGYNFEMVVCEEGIYIMLTDRHKEFYHIDVLGNSKSGFYRSMIDILEAIAKRLNYPGCPVDRDELLSLKASSLLSGGYRIYTMNELIEALAISIRGE